MRKLWVVAACLASAAPAGALPLDSAATAQIERRCGGEADRTECVFTVLRDVVDRDGLQRAMSILDELVARDDAYVADAHSVAHRIGIHAYTSPEALPDLLQSCPVTHRSGCHHGVLQAYLLELKRSGNPITAEQVRVCESHVERAAMLAFQCAHGLGHGLMALHDDSLPAALRSCDLLGTETMRLYCQQGAFMENVVLVTHPHTATLAHHPGQAHGAAGGHDGHDGHARARSWEPLKADDHQYPCSVVDEKYASTCYDMQASAMLHHNGRDLQRTAADCRRAPPAYVSTCLAGLGRHITAFARENPAESAALCASLGPDAELDCARGAAVTLVNVRSEGGDGIALCRAVTDAATKRACYVAVGGVLVVYAPEASRRAAACNLAELEYRSVCASAAYLPTTDVSGSEQ